MTDLGSEKWYVVRSQTKRERSAAQYLRKELCLEVVAPQVSYIKSTRRGKVRWREAMFPGYLFAKFDLASLERAVCYAPGVLTLVKFGENRPSIDELFIEQLKSLVSENEELELDRVVKKGGIYEISSGPMKGQEGEVIEVMNGGERVTLLMNLIGESREVDVDIYSLLLSARPDLE